MGETREEHNIFSMGLSLCFYTSFLLPTSNILIQIFLNCQHPINIFSQICCCCCFFLRHHQRTWEIGLSRFFLSLFVQIIAYGWQFKDLLINLVCLHAHTSNKSEEEEEEKINRKSFDFRIFTPFYYWQCGNVIKQEPTYPYLIIIKNCKVWKHLLIQCCSFFNWFVCPTSIGCVTVTMPEWFVCIIRMRVDTSN